MAHGAAQRCACVLLPTVADLAVRLAPGVQLSPSLSSTLSVVVFSAQVTTMWALALGLRLRLRDHLLPHALFAVDVVLRQAPALCSAPFISVGGMRAGKRMRGCACALESWLPATARGWVPL